MILLEVDSYNIVVLSFDDESCGTHVAYAEN